MSDNSSSHPSAQNQYPQSPSHVKWFVKTGEVLKTSDGRIVEIWEFSHVRDENILSAWAKHFRNQYCLDEQIDLLREGTGYSRADYLTNIKFPDESSGLGPGIRAGDFAEILVADYVEYLLGYWVPRTRYVNKVVRNESLKGSDIIGLKFVEEGRDSKQDALAMFEAKTDFSGKGTLKRLQDAIDDSAKDLTRKAESLNAIKQRFLDLRQSTEAEKIKRFQNPVDRPYLERYGAVVVLETQTFDKQAITQANGSAHPSPNLALLIVHGGDMMKLVHALYRRAADEA